MNNLRTSRLFRGAVTTVCLSLCAIAVVMWIRSYYYVDTIVKKTNWQIFDIGSALGQVQFYYLDVRRQTPQPSQQAASDVLNEVIPHEGRNSFRLKWSPPAMTSGVLGFAWVNANPKPLATSVMIPYWFIVLLLSASAVAPWFQRRWRFGLRTLFLFMTLVALGLGLAAIAIR